MITLNLSRKEVYAFTVMATFTPLLLLIACLLGVGYLQSQNFEYFQSIDKTTTSSGNSSNETASQLALLPDSLQEFSMPVDYENLELTTSIAEEDSTAGIELSPEVINFTLEASNDISEKLITTDTIAVIEEVTIETHLSSTDKFSVQLASFANLSNAYSFIEALSVEAQFVKVPQPKVMIRLNSKTPYVVVLGNYNNQNEARGAATLYNKTESTKNIGAFGVDLAHLGELDSIASL